MSDILFSPGAYVALSLSSDCVCVFHLYILSFSFNNSRFDQLVGASASMHMNLQQLNQWWGDDQWEVQVLSGSPSSTAPVSPSWWSTTQRKKQGWGQIIRLSSHCWALIYDFVVRKTFFNISCCFPSVQQMVLFIDLIISVQRKFNTT